MADAVTEPTQVKTGVWSPDECCLAVWAYDRLDEDRSLKEQVIIQDLADRLGRGFEDARTRVHNVAACDPRPADLKPVNGDANIQGKLRIIFSEYWADREAGRGRIQKLLGTPEDLEDAPLPTCWMEALERFPSHELGESLGKVIRAVVELLEQGSTTPSGVSLNQITNQLLDSGQGRPSYVKATLDALSREFGLCQVWYHLPKRGLGPGAKREENASSLGFLPTYAEALESPIHRKRLLQELDRLQGLIPENRESDTTQLTEALRLGSVALTDVESGASDAKHAWFRLDLPTLEALSAGPWKKEPAFKRAGERLGSLQAFPLILKATWCARPLPTDSLNALAEAAKELDVRTSRMKVPPPPDPKAFEKAVAHWEDAERDASKLDRREVRCLCLHAETAVSPGWVEALARAKGLKLRRSWIEYLLGHYLGLWRTMPQPEQLEAALRNLLDHLPSHETWAQELSRNARILIGPDVPKRLLKDVPNVLTGWEDVLHQWELSREVGLGCALMLEALRAWEATWRTTRPNMPVANALVELRSAFQRLLREPGIPSEILCRVVSSLILSEWAKNESEMREHLVELVLHHPRLGDPRKEKQHWYPMVQARDRLISWMARKDLRLFYDSVVADHSDDQGRKAFWLRYVEKVSDFRLVLCAEDILRLKAALGTNPIQYATMEGTNKPSAFILRFNSKQNGEDLVCVEFSKTGNSLYVFDATAFETGVGRMDARSFRIGAEPRNLKNREYCKTSIRHAGNWQYDVADFLRQHGIGPS